MALPYSPPRSTYDIEIDLDVDLNFRVAHSNTYNGKHILVKGRKSTIDRRGCFNFVDCASVTIIGGHFEPPADSWAQFSNGNFAPATFTFTGIGKQPNGTEGRGFVYMEGVLIDNKNLIVDMSDQRENGGDAVFLSGKENSTDLTVVNCRWVNVRGVENLTNVASDDVKKAHGDIFQTGSTTQGKAGNVKFYNFTGSGNYQGFFLDPQERPAGETYPDGGMESLTLERVNLRRTANVSGTRLLFLTSSEENYNLRGFPASFTDVYLQPNFTGTSFQIDNCIWPSNVAAGNGQFTNTKYRATIATDTSNGRRYATWPGLNNTGKVISGRVYEGDAPVTGGDYVSASAVGLNYVQGTDIGGGTAPLSDTAGPAWNAGSNLLLPQNWSKVGTGQIGIDYRTGEVAIKPTGSRTSVTQMVPTEIGAKYRLSYHVNGTDDMARQIGSAAGLQNLVADGFGGIAPGDNAIDFIATSTSTFVEITRTSASSPVVSSLILEKWPDGATLARRLDGIGQRFSIDLATNGLRTANYSLFLGGHFMWTYFPLVTPYIAEIGDPALSTSWGRVRIFYDVAQGSLKCSVNNAAGNAYRECAYTVSLTRGVWYHVAVAVTAARDCQLYLNGVAQGTKTGTIPAASETTFKALTIGSRAGSGSGASNFNPAKYADWVWCPDFVPTQAQITQLASGTSRPSDVTGMPGMVWWAFDGVSTTEAAKSGTATLTATGAPATIIGPMVGTVEPEPPPVIVRPLDCIII